MKCLVLFLFLFGCGETIEEQMCRYNRNDLLDCEYNLKHYQERCNWDSACSCSEIEDLKRDLYIMRQRWIENRASLEADLEICREGLNLCTCDFPEEE